MCILLFLSSFRPRVCNTAVCGYRYITVVDDSIYILNREEIRRGRTRKRKHASREGGMLHSTKGLIAVGKTVPRNRRQTPTNVFGGFGEISCCEIPGHRRYGRVERRSLQSAVFQMLLFLRFGVWGRFTVCLPCMI